MRTMKKITLEGDCMYSQEQFDRLRSVMEQWKQKPGPLMPVMHEAQEIFGCLDESVQMFISEHLCINMTQIYDVATFYSRFTLQPKGKYTIGVCLGTACYVRGSNNILDAFVSQLGIEPGSTTADGLFTIEAVRCIGCCGLSPAICVNEDIYGKFKANDVAGLIEKYRAAQAQ